MTNFAVDENQNLFSRIKKTIAATMALFSAFGTSADVVSDARELMDGADFEAAEQILTAELDRASEKQPGWNAQPAPGRMPF